MNQAIENLELTFLKYTDLVFDKKNPNKMTETQMDGIVAAMKHQGMNEALIVMRHELDKKGKIIKKFRNKIANGEHRAIAWCERLKNKTVPCFYYDMTEGMRLLIRQTHNKNHGLHDAEMDSAEFKLMKKLGLEKLLKIQTTMSDEEFDKIINWGKDKALENTKVEFEITHSCGVPGCSHGQ